MYVVNKIFALHLNGFCDGARVFSAIYQMQPQKTSGLCKTCVKLKAYFLPCVFACKAGNFCHCLFYGGAVLFAIKSAGFKSVAGAGSGLQFFLFLCVL